MKDLKEYLQDESIMSFFDHGVLTDEGIVNLLDNNRTIHGIFHKKDKKIIGHFVYSPYYMVDTYEVGWLINKKYHNQGIVTSLAKAFLDFSFNKDKAHRVIATCDPRNIASNRICEKLGMRLEAQFKKANYVPRLNEWWDENFYAIIDSEHIGE